MEAMKKNKQTVKYVGSYLPVLGCELAHQHAHVVRVPHPVLAAEILQQTDGLVQTVEDAHHPETNGRESVKVTVSLCLIGTELN